MLKNMFMFCAMSFFLISWLSAQEKSLYEIPEYPELRIESVYKFEGDKHGDFKGDFVTVLSDGSRWKIHPQDSYKYRKWSTGSPVHIAKRTSYYYFKREHKFELVNLTNNETVRAMLVQYPPTPLFIAYIEQIESGVPFRTYSKGNQIVKTKYSTRSETFLHLSDGTIWKINPYPFLWEEGAHAGAYVYVSFNKDGTGFDYFLITDLEREAKHYRIVKARLVKHEFEEYEEE